MCLLRPTIAVYRHLSALAHWSPVMAEAEFLPAFVFPFIKVFENNPLHAFELVMTVLLNWSQQWFEFFPHPPVNVRCFFITRGF
jgi:hypothetical protein